MALLNCCIVCFRIGSFNHSDSLENEKFDDEENLKVFKRFFKLLDRHLNCTEGEERSAHPTCKSKDDSKLGKKLFFNYVNSVKEAQACEDCFKLMSSFCEIYHKIKSLELLLSGKTWSLMNVMFCAMKIPARINSFKDTINQEETAKIYGDYVQSDGDDVANFLIQYKKQLVAMCARKLTNSYPKLILEKTTPFMQNPVELHVSKETDKEVYKRECVNSESSLPTGNDEDVFDLGIQFSPPSSIQDDAPSLEIENDLDNANQGSLPQLLDNQGKDKQPSTYEPNFGLDADNLTGTKSVSRSLRVIHRCKSCKRTFSSEEKLAHHKNTEDCSHLESDADSDIEEGRAKKLKTENDELKNCAFPEPNKETESSSCEEGGNVAVDSARHRAKLTPKLRRKRNEGKLCCPICKQNFWITLQIYTHLNESHPEAFLISPEQTKEVEPFACPLFYCPGTFDNIRSVQNHCLVKHKEEFNFRKRVGGKNCLARDLNEPSRCPLPNCESFCANKGVLVIHLEFKHSSEWSPRNLSFLSKRFFRARLAQLKNNFALESSDKDSDPLKDTKLFDDFEDEQQSNSEQSTSRVSRLLKTACPECTELFANFYEMVLHYKSKHILTPDMAKQNFIVKILNVSKQSSDQVQTYANREEIEVFAKIEVTPNVFICHTEKCLQLFSYEEDLQAHSKLHGEFKCKYCETVKHYAVDLAEHEIKEHTENSGLHKNNEFKILLNCPRCDESFKSKEKYVSHHISAHLGIERFVEEGCPICRDPRAHSKRYSTRRVEWHLRMVHNIHPDKNGTSPLLQRCRAEGCGASFLLKRHMRFHCQRVHGFEIEENKELECKTSAGNGSSLKRSSASSRLAFKKRIRKKKDKMCRPVCKDCGKTLKNKKILKLHRINLHVSVDKLIYCTVKGCERKFEFKEDLDSHLKIGHRGKTEMEMCPKCGKYLIAGLNLRQHLSAHEREEKNESGEKSFVCEGCGKSFKKQHRLDQHVLQVHTGSDSWKFECSVCSKKFPKKWTLNVHMRVHTGEKPFVCQVCGQAYSHRHNLRIHVNSKHGDVIQDIAKNRDTSNDAPKRKRKGILSKQKK